MVDQFILDPKYRIDKEDPIKAMHIAELKAGQSRHMIKFYEDTIVELKAAIDRISLGHFSDTKLQNLH